MLSGSGELQEYISKGDSFKSNANLTLTNGTTIKLTPSDFLFGGGFSIESATSNRNTFDIGAVIPKKLTMKLINYEGQFNLYDFESAYVTNTEVFATLPSGTTETIKKGQFKVDKQVFNSGIVTLTCYDKLAELDTLYSGVYTEQTALEFCQYIADKLGISLNATNFNNRTMTFIIPQESYTDRDLLNYVLQATCNFAYIDVNNQLVIRWYDLATLDVADDLINAGTFRLPSVDIYDAGNFTDMSDSQQVFDAGTFTDISRRLNIETIFGSPTVDVDNVVITGVIVKDIDGNEYVSGTKAYAITIDSNPLIKGREQEVSKAVADIIVGMTFRPMNITALNNPLIEAGDIATVVIKSNPYATIFTNVTYGIGKRSKLVCGAESPGKNSSVRNTESNKAYIQSKEYTNTKVETAISSYDKAIQDLTTLMSQSFGVFKTEEKQDDGSIVYYMHNKPSLSDSNIQWKMTADGLAVSTDYGENWNAGIDASGNAVVNVLSAVGISADWIKGGIITSDISSTAALNVMGLLYASGAVQIDANIYEPNSMVFGQIVNGNKAHIIRLIPTPTEGIGYDYKDIDTDEVTDKVRLTHNGLFGDSNWSGGFALSPNYLTIGGVKMTKDQLTKLLALIS